MPISPITSLNHQEFTKSYATWKNRFTVMQFIPVVSIVGCAGMLALDAKTWVVNNFFTENVQRHENLSLKQSVASQTYDDPGSLGPASSPNDFSSFQVRLFSALNLLTGGCLGPIVAIVIIVAGCLGGLCC